MPLPLVLAGVATCFQQPGRPGALCSVSSDRGWDRGIESIILSAESRESVAAFGAWLSIRGMQGSAGQGRAWQGRAWQGRAGQTRAAQGRAAQGVQRGTADVRRAFRYKS